MHLVVKEGDDEEDAFVSKKPGSQLGLFLAVAKQNGPMLELLLDEFKAAFIADDLIEVVQFLFFEDKPWIQGI